MNQAITTISVVLDQPLLERIEGFRREKGEKLGGLNRSQVIRCLLNDGLALADSGKVAPCHSPTTP